jgi:hypothetical protein
LADVGGGHGGGGQAGQDGKGQTGGLKRVNLFVQPPENTRIAALQAHDTCTG